MTDRRWRVEKTQPRKEEKGQLLLPKKSGSRTSQDASQIWGSQGGDAPLTTSRPRGDEGDELGFEQTELEMPVCAVAYTC